VTTLVRCVALSKNIAHEYANGLGKFEKMKEGLGGKEVPIDTAYITQIMHLLTINCMLMS